MLLSVDKVLSLLEDGKSTEKIAELADASIEDVIKLISEARRIVSVKDPLRARKKIKLKKKSRQSEQSGFNQEIEGELFKGADLAVVPLENILTFYCATSIYHNLISVGIEIHDNDGHRVGKVQYRETGKNERLVLVRALIRCEKIAQYFNSKKTRLRFDDEYLYRQIIGEKAEFESILVDDIKVLQLVLSDQRLDVHLELIERHQNERARFLTESS